MRRIGAILLAIELLLGIGHLLWPEYRWGQGRQSYFNLANSLTLASWLASVQLIGVAVLALISLHRERSRTLTSDSRNWWVWVPAALCALAMSFVEFSRIHHRFEFFDLPKPDEYGLFITLCMSVLVLSLFGWFLLARLRGNRAGVLFGVAWLMAWGLDRALCTRFTFDIDILDPMEGWISLVEHLAYYVGITLLLMAVGEHALRPATALGTRQTDTVAVDAALPAGQQACDAGWPQGSRLVLVFLGVGSMTFTIIFLQIVLFQMLNIFGDYMTANSVISIALLGIAVGGLIGASRATCAPMSTMAGASLLLPASILLAFGSIVDLTASNPLVTSALLTVPFICCSTVITVALVRSRSHVVYCIDLLGAALGALLVSGALSRFREESTVLFLVAFTFLVSLFFIIPLARHPAKKYLAALSLAGALGLTLFGVWNLEADGLNIVRTNSVRRMPRAKVLYSRSSFVGRYDIIRRRPSHTSLSTYDNGRIIDNIRNRPTEQYQIDPRVPHTLMEDPTILILGLSGDGISKTAKALCTKVYGVEINPAIVALQTNELVKYNADSYADIEVAVMDGRSYVEQSDQLYDMITLMNAHSARGRTSGRAPSPEYLHTGEAIEAYMSHLTDRGILIVEEPVSYARREPPVWKLVATMRQVLLDRGQEHPERHFFIFQWKTARNNYMQILMKKTPFTDEELAKLRKWLEDVDNRKRIEAQTRRRMGPISCKCTILFAPDEPLDTLYARILRGETDEVFIEARNLHATTDDRPFHFDVDPARPEFTKAYGRTLIMTLVLAPFLLSFLWRYRPALRSALPYVFIVSLTGLGYLLIEVVFIQRFEIFLGSPVVTFCTVLGTMLLFSGIGSLWSGRVAGRGLYGSLVAIIVLLAAHQWGFPKLFPLGASLPLVAKVAGSVLAIAPLAFFMGVPFPFVLRMGKVRFTEATAAVLFGINAAASALAVPLSVNISAAYGFAAVFQTGIVLYAVVGLLVVALRRPTIQLLANATAILAVVVLLASPWFISRRAVAATDMPDTYRVYALHYGDSTYGRDKVFHGGSRSRVPFAWYCWVIQGEGRTILVDTGFDDPKMVKEWRIRNYVKPVELLARLGITPAEVTDVIITHAHWDHVGGIAPYTNAALWIQETEYDHAHSSLSEERGRAKGMRWQDLERLQEAERQGRLRRIHGDTELVPGIIMVHGGSHTPGQQYVEVDTLDGRVILAGDVTYLYENNQWHRPIGSSVDHDANLATIRKMHGRAISPFFIIPGHDPRVAAHFPEVAPGIVQITAVEE